MTTRRRGPRVTEPVAPDPRVEWSTLKSQNTPYLSYKHICSYDGPVTDCPGCQARKEDPDVGTAARSICP